MASDLSIGSQAPSIKMLTLIRGNPISSFQPGKISILVYFSTHCDGCRKALVDLGPLQEKYIGVEVIGVVGNEQAPTADEVRPVVESWLAETLSNSNISMAFDHTGEIDKRWMDASCSFLVPQAFVVGRDGALDFIGDPVSLDHILPKSIDGSWRNSAEAKLTEKERLAEGEIYVLEKALMDRINTAREDKDWKVAVSAIQEAISESPDDPSWREYHVEVLIESMRELEAGWIALARFAREAIERNCEDWLRAAMRQLFDSQYDYPRLALAERFSVGKELSDCILRLSEQQDALSRAQSYETVAPYYHESGDNSRALELIEQAIVLVKSGSLPDDEKQEWLAQLLRALEKYKG
jgi:tetratricopeptide (TPR) repeat protein